VCHVGRGTDTAAATAVAGPHPDRRPGTACTVRDVRRGPPEGVRPPRRSARPADGDAPEESASEESSAEESATEESSAEESRRARRTAPARRGRRRGGRPSRPPLSGRRARPGDRPHCRRV